MLYTYLLVIVVTLQLLKIKDVAFVSNVTLNVSPVTYVQIFNGFVASAFHANIMIL